MPGPARLNHRHEQIVNWLVANPDQTLGMCAQHFGYTQPWLSMIVHCDAFQARYAERCAETGSYVVHTAKNRLTNLAVRVMERAEQVIDGGGASERFLGETMKTTLSALGYTGNGGDQSPGSQQHLHVHVDAETLIAAREKALNGKMGQTVAKQLPDVSTDPFEAPASQSVVDERGVKVA